MRYSTHLIYTAVAVSLLLTATILVAPLSITDGLKILQQARADGPEVNFSITDNPGSWFRNDEPGTIGATDSLAITTPGATVYFNMDETRTVHTITSLLWPRDAANMPHDQNAAFNGPDQVVLEDAGLYVFVCKLHPFMLGAVIVDDPATTYDNPETGVVETDPAYDLGNDDADDPINDYTLTLVSLPSVPIPTSSDLATRLVRAFYVITGAAGGGEDFPSTWQDFSTGQWVVNFPGVNVVRDDGIVNLDALDIDEELPDLFKPKKKGVGEVWIATQYETTDGRDKPGTLTVVDAGNWKVKRKVSLPDLDPEMNNPHNMWTDRDQKLIYTTQWFDKYLTTVDRKSGEMVNHVQVGEAPAHVMTRANNDEVHVTINGEHRVVALAPGGGTITNPNIDVTTTPLDPGAFPAQPHAHWMGADGQTMVTPNSNTGDSTLYSFTTSSIEAKPETGALPIATGMMPDSSKYYVSNFLSNTISVIDMATGTKIKDINLLADYHPITGVIADGVNPLDSEGADGVTAVGALPIQTPVAPNGKYMVTANTLTATITIVDTDDEDPDKEDVLEKMLACDAGCHGVQFGAKKGGGYYAYVTSKFANTLLVVDIDPNNDGEADDAKIVGRLLLEATQNTKTDADITTYTGMGGQGVLAIPVVYNGWVQNLPENWQAKLTDEQLDPLG